MSTKRRERKKTCGWWSGHGADRQSCHNVATHEWKSNCGGDWSPRCNVHSVEPAKPGEMLAGGYRHVRPLPSGQRVDRMPELIAENRRLLAERDALLLRNRDNDRSDDAPTYNGYATKRFDNQMGE